MLLTVALIVILFVAIGDLAYLNYMINSEAASKTRDSDGDGLSDWYEIHVHHTDPHKVDTSGLGIDDFNAIYTYGLNPRNQTAVKEFLQYLPNATARHWELTDGGVGGYTIEKYVKISLRDPYIKYLLNNTEIKWRDTPDGKVGMLLVNGQPISSGIKPKDYIATDSINQPSYYFTHGRFAACGESQLADFTILQGLGYPSVGVGNPNHVWNEALINGNIYAVEGGRIDPREVLYKGGLHNITFAYGFPSYNPNWFKDNTNTILSDNLLI